MADMLVKLLELPALEPVLETMRAKEIAVRRALVPELPVVLRWVQSLYPTWAAEVEVAFTRDPVACIIAVKDSHLVGFAVHDVVCRNFFGPMAVSDAVRAQGIGRALTLATLHAQRAAGYAYAIIGGVGPEAFYAKVAGAITIAASTPGIYAGM